MNIGLFISSARPDQDRDFLRAVGVAAEDRGFHSLWVAEHVVMFDHYRSIPASMVERTLGTQEHGILDPFAVLSYLAAATERIRLGTGICILPQRNPVLTAKEAATIDILSGGRLDLGVGLGWVEEEYEALGVPFEKRGSICDSYITVLTKLWTDAVSEHEDDNYRLAACRQYPKPLQKPHPPIHVGGNSPPALRRAASLAQGWYAFGLDPSQFAEALASLEDLLGVRGRRRDEVEVSVCGYLAPVGFDEVERYRRAGADQVILFALDLSPDDYQRRLDEWAHTIVEPAAPL